MPDEGDSRASQSEPSRDAAWLDLSVVHDDGVWLDLAATEALIEQACRALAAHPKFKRSRRAEACVALSSDTAVRALNGTYRAKDMPTNVLSFPANPGLPRDADAPRWLGDVVIAEETVAKEAKEQGISQAHHLQHLVVHGVLHLLGYDHETDAKAEAMEGLEVEILDALGIANPYADAPRPAKESIGR